VARWSLPSGSAKLLASTSQLLQEQCLDFEAHGYFVFYLYITLR